MQPITPHLIEQAKFMRNWNNASWHRIAKTLDVSEYAMRCALDPAYHAYKRGEWARKTNPNRSKLKHATHRIVHSHTHLAPPEVLAERELVQELALKPRSITSELLGDPLPGRSALDRQRK